MKVQVSGLKAVGLELSLPQLLTSKNSLHDLRILNSNKPLV